MRVQVLVVSVFAVAALAPAAATAERASPKDIVRESARLRALVQHLQEGTNLAALVREFKKLAEKGVTSDIRREATFHQATLYHEHSGAAELKETARLFAKLATSVGDEWGIKAAVELGDMRRKADDLDAAIEAYERILRKHIIEPEAVRAALGVGLILAKRGDKANAKKAFEYGKAVARQLYEGDRKGLAAVLKTIDAALRRLKPPRKKKPSDVDRYGEAFVLHREAERLRFRGAHKAALAKYTEIQAKHPKTVWSEASQMYSGYCFMAMGRGEKAEAVWRGFVSADRLGLFRGEAILALGYMDLNERLNVTRAAVSFQQLSMWLKDVGAEDGYKTPEIEQRARAVSRAAEVEYAKNPFGFLRRVKVRPGELRNRRTCSWYLRWLKKRLILGQGFHLVLQRDVAGASKHFAALRELDDEVAYLSAEGGPNTITRLVGAAECGYINCDEKEMAGLTSRGRTAALLGDYWFAALERDVARLVYRKLANGGYGHASIYDRAYGVLGLGSCDYFEEDYDAAARHFARFEKEFARTPITAYGLFSLGQSIYMPFNYAKGKDRNVRKRWEAAFLGAARVGGRSFWGEYARFRLGMNYALSARYREQGQRVLAQVAVRCKNSKSKRTRSLADLAEVLIEDSCSGSAVYPIE